MMTKTKIFTYINLLLGSLPTTGKSGNTAKSILEVNHINDSSILGFFLYIINGQNITISIPMLITNL